MSLPKSKMISASKAIMAIAAKARYNTDDSVKAIQNQTVTVNVQQHPTTTLSPATTINNTSRPQTAPVHLRSQEAAAPSAPEIIERDIHLEDDSEISATAYDAPIKTPAPAAPVTPPTEFVEPETDYYQELETLHAMVSNYETVSKALILIIELMMSNPLVINKIIVPTEEVFRELVKVLTGADEVEIRYTEEVGCTLGSKKYKPVEDIIVIKHTEPKSLKYSHPDVIRLFDRFNISVKMLAKQ